MTLARDLDSKLPLSQAFELEVVSRRLEQVWRVAEGADIVVDACKRVDASYEPRTRCIVTYELSGTLPSRLSRRTIGVVEVTPKHVAHRLFHQDPRLPQLETATDRNAMGERMQALTPELVGAGQLELRQISPMRYHPERSCVLHYAVETAEGDQAFVGKLFGEHGERVMAATVALHRASQVERWMPRIPRPVAYWQDLQLLLQPEVKRGGELRVLAFDPASPEHLRLGWLRGVGIGLAALHSSVRAEAQLRTIEDDLGELEQYRELLASIAPETARSFGEALTAISASASQHAEPAPVPSHGAFRLDQLLLGEDGLVMLDVDGFCSANPARDVANLLAYLDWKAIRLPELADFVDRSQQAFLGGYTMDRPRPAEPWLTLYRIASILKIAGRRYRSLSFDEWPLIPALLAGARQRLAA